MLTRGHAREKVPNPTGATPCATCPKIPPEAPQRNAAYALEMSERNWLAWRHNRECAAVGRFPDDPIVRRNAAAIAEVLRRVEDVRWTFLSQIVALGKK